MLRLLILLGGAPGALSYFFDGPAGAHRRKRVTEALARVSQTAASARAGADARSPAAHLLARLATAAVVARTARLAGLRGSLMAIAVGKLAQSSSGKGSDRIR